MNPIFYLDAYKFGHVYQYASGITRVWTNWTPRSSRRPERKGVIHFGLQYFLMKVLIRDFSERFFDVPIGIVLSEYRAVIKAMLGIANPDVDHIKALHRLGRLPIDIYSLPEGAFVPCGVPAMVIVNTDPAFFWLPNYLETILSNTLWMPSTSATTATIYREIFTKAARAFGETDLSFVDWQGHDFSMRGLPGVEAAMTSGIGHLLSFTGTDSVPAILAARDYYGAELDCGKTVPATEHSVMCAGSQEGEFETFRRLITEVYPTGAVSIVSDTWDLWRVLTDYLPRLKDIILARDGIVVLRPDSGDPESILCGNKASSFGPERAGVFRLIAEVMGTDGRGHINKMKAIYGDSITIERADSITSRMVNELKLSPFNGIFGIGSFSYQYVTRDTFGFAMKATAVERNGVVVPIFKDPVTDDGGKRSLKGIPVVYRGLVGQGDVAGRYYVEVTDNPAQLDSCAFRKVLADGRIEVLDTFTDIRDRARAA